MGDAGPWNSDFWARPTEFPIQLVWAGAHEFAFLTSCGWCWQGRCRPCLEGFWERIGTRDFSSRNSQTSKRILSPIPPFFFFSGSIRFSPDWNGMSGVFIPQRADASNYKSNSRVKQPQFKLQHPVSQCSPRQEHVRGEFSTLRKMPNWRVI